MKVKATDEYIKRNITDKVLGRVPKQGEVFEVSEERFKILNGKNSYKAIFVKAVEEKKIEVAKKETKTEKAVKKTTKKAK